MNKLYYCTHCKKIIGNNEECNYCNGKDIKELKRGTPVNVIGSKLKGKILKIKNKQVTLLLINEMKEKYLKDYEYDKLRKVI